MAVLEVNCNNQKLKWVEEPAQLFSGNIKIDGITFSFCPLWDGFIKTAVFYKEGKEAVHILLDEKNTCLIPPEVTDTSGLVYVGVFGIKDDCRRTTEPICFYLDEGITTAGNPSEPTPDIYAQILTRFATTVGKKTVEGGEIFNDYENNVASAIYSHAEGMKTKVKDKYGHAEGRETEAGYAGHAEGLRTKAGQYAHAEGENTEASGRASHAEGLNTEATGQAAHAEGLGSKATGYVSHTEGQNTEATGNFAHAEGHATKATGAGAHAEGYETKAAGSHAHVEGARNTASGEQAHAEGHATRAEGRASHTEGTDTKAIGDRAHAEGYLTIATGGAQHVQGKCNIEDTEGKYAHIVGNGPDGNNRSNAHTLDWDGNAWFAGTVEATAIILKSTTKGSTKRFKITVDDTGALTVKEITP